MDKQFNIMEAVLQLTILVFAVIMHEFAHGYVAFRLGDPTAKLANRLNLNPLNHIDLMGSIILPLMLTLGGSPVVLGWAKPVPVNYGYFRHPRRDTILVSIAGVTTNLVIAVIAGLLLRLSLLLNLSLPYHVSYFLLWTCVTNVCLAVFNMMPIPPLDGSHVLAELLPTRLAENYLSLGRFGFLIIFALFYLGPLGKVMEPIIKLLLGLLLGGT